MPPLDNGKALSMLFRGYSARRVAEKLHSSNVTVSNLLKKFKKEAEEAESVLAAAANYGIEDQVDQLITIGRVVEDSGVDLSRAGLGLRIVKTAEDFGVDPEGRI
jgi:predicted transcriptional regulator